MKIYSALLLAGTALFFTHPALATVCRNSNGTATDIFMTCQMFSPAAIISRDRWLRCWKNQVGAA